MVGLTRYGGVSIAEPVGVVRLQEDASSLARNLVGATAEAAAAASRLGRDAEARYISDFGLTHRAKQAELAAANPLDAKAFASAWEGHAEGTLAQVPWAFRASARQTLGELGTSAYSTILQRQAANERQNAEQSWTALLQAREQEYLGHIRAGRVREADAARVQYDAQLEQGRGLGYIDGEGETFRRQRLGATGSAVILEGEAMRAYRTGGRAAADAVLKRLDTDPAFATVRRDATSAETVRTNVRRAIAEAERDAARARAELADEVNYQLQRIGDGERADWSVVQRAAKSFGEATPQGKQVRKLLALAPALEGFAKLTPAAMEADIAETAGRYSDPKAPPEERAELVAKERIYTRAVSAIKNDDFSYAVRKYGAADDAPGPIDFARPGTNIAELRRRALIVAATAPALGHEPLPFSRQELQRAVSIFSTASPADKAAIVAEWRDGLGDRLAARVIAGASKEGAAPAAVYAAFVARQDPVIARQIYEGQAVLAGEKKVKLLKEEDFQRTFNELTGSAFRLNDGARVAAVEAARARIALWAKDNGKLGEEVPPTIQRDIIKSTLGNIIEHRGNKLLPPRRDMTQRDFDADLSMIEDRDAPELRALDGSKFGITRALRAGRLVSAGEGRYAIMLGEGFFVPDPRDPRRPFYVTADMMEAARRRQQYEDFGAYTGGEPAPRRGVAPPEAPLLPAAPAGSRNRKEQTPAYRRGSE